MATDKGNELPSIPPELQVLTQMDHLVGLLGEIDKGKHTTYMTPLAEICNWNGLRIQLRKQTHQGVPKQLKIVDKNKETDPNFEKFANQLPFQALVLTRGITEGLRQINPSLLSSLPQLTGLNHQLRTLLVPKSFTNKDFEPIDAALDRAQIVFS